MRGRIKMENLHEGLKNSQILLDLVTLVKRRVVLWIYVTD
jgi:hypothetical protein